MPTPPGVGSSSCLRAPRPSATHRPGTALLANALVDATALILAGGLGTRLRPAIGTRPKVLANVGGAPFVLHLLRRLAAAGVRRAVLCTGYQGDVVRAELGDVAAGVRLDYSHEPEPLGTGGALRHALARVASPTVLVSNGDSLSDTDIRAAWRFHHACGAAATIALATCDDAARYGRVEVDDRRRVRRFAEKSPDGSHGPAWINTGLYLLAAETIAAIPQGRPVSLEREILPALVGHGLFGFPGARRFLDIGVPADFAAAEAFLRGLDHPATISTQPATGGSSA